MGLLDTIKHTAKNINEGNAAIDSKKLQSKADGIEQIRKDIVRAHKPLPKQTMQNSFSKQQPEEDKNNPIKKAIDAIQTKFTKEYFADLIDKKQKANTKNESVDEGILSGIGSVAKGAAKTVGNVAHDVANLPGDPDKLHPIAGISRHVDSIGKTAHTINRSFSSKPVSSGSLSTRANKVGGVHTGMTHRAEEVDLDEKHLTPAELKKREEIARAIERENPNMPISKKMAIATSTAKKVAEDIGLDEGRGRPPKEGSKAYLAAQAKAKSGDVDDSYEADKNIRTQLQKAISVGKPVTFNNGETKKIEPAHAHKALSLLDKTAKPADKENLQKSLGHSHDRFHETIKGGKPIIDPARPRVSLGKMKAESVVMEDERIADKGPVKSIIKMINGQPKLVKYTPPRAEINVESVDCLNNLYNDLSEENKVFFDQMLETEQGLASLLDFAIKQGY